MIHQKQLSIKNNGRGTYEITRQVQEFVQASSIDTGLCHIFVHHTSASLMLCENADPTVRIDLENFMQRIAPDGDPVYQHDDEGPDDMPAHIRSVITQTGLSIPVTQGQCNLGTWQGIYLWEHRNHSHTRTLTLTLQG
jgi:secondary thiamine-phosphate synthase enzyme